MKSKLLLLSFLMLFTFTTNYAQTSASVSGIAVQGIARNNNNTALINAEVRFTFRIYDKSTDTDIYTENPTITTDEFGVFSHVLDIPVEKNSEFANKELWLEIKDSTGPISDEVFKQVPYAIVASNGVPTGSIMPYIGAEAPEGWVICDGRVLSDPETQALRDLLGGNNAPNLQGMFLRGTGESPVNNEDGPALMTTQGDGNKEHSHGPGNLSTNSTGNHSHTTQFYNDDYNGSGGGDTTHSGLQRGLEDDVNPTGSISIRTDLPTTTTGNHSHLVNSGSTSISGIAETRPVNYGVNYIIKL